MTQEERRPALSVYPPPPAASSRFVHPLQDTYTPSTRYLRNGTHAYYEQAPNHNLPHAVQPQWANRGRPQTVRVMSTSKSIPNLQTSPLFDRGEVMPPEMAFFETQSPSSVGLNKKMSQYRKLNFTELKDLLWKKTSGTFSSPAHDEPEDPSRAAAPAASAMTHRAAEIVRRHQSRSVSCGGGGGGSSRRSKSCSRSGAPDLPTHAQQLCAIRQQHARHTVPRQTVV